MLPHPFDVNRFFSLTCDFFHKLKTMSNNWLFQKNFEKIMYFPKLDDIEVDKCSFPFVLIQHLFKMFASIDNKGIFPLRKERQNDRLVLKVNELTLSALQIQNEARCEEYRNHTSGSSFLLFGNIQRCTPQRNQLNDNKHH